MPKKAPITDRCPKTGRCVELRRSAFWGAIALGVGSVCWFLARVVPKPSRASYPCQRAAAATAGGFIVWLFGAGGFAALFRKVARPMDRSRWAGACAYAGIAALGLAWTLLAQPALPAHAYTTWTPTEGPNAPMGTARGIHPGRVVWSYDPASTSWDGVNGHWWDPASADQSRVDAMMSKAVQALTGTTSDEAAWSALFTSFNQSHGRGAYGYSAGQTIVIKINQNTARQGHAENGLGTGNDQNPINGDPHVILELLRQLVRKAGVPEANIYVYDISRYITDSIYVPCSAEFPAVHYVELSTGGGAGREAFNGVWARNAITYAGTNTPGRDVPNFVAQASYMINLASMKAHGDDAGPTLHAKLHYGTISGLNHTWPNGSNVYSYFVELMGSKYLGENTFLFMIDALYGANGADAKPSRWSIYPFTSWPSSLFVSQDGVASESVGWDFIDSQWGVPAGSDNTLKEAATANAPGSGANYAPNGDGARLPSLGVHEHWNNVTEKKYSRNLGTGDGIELVQVLAADASIPLSRTGWVATASNAGDLPSNAIDGNMNTRWTTGAGQAVGQGFELDMGAAQKFTRITLDANGSADYPAGYQVFASNDGASWGTAIASGAGTSSRTAISFAEQNARFLKIVLTADGSHWWSIHEINVFGTSGSSVPAPTITTQPASQTVAVGQTATFNVVATGSGALTYQWSKNGAAITGATGASYTTPAAISADNGAQFTVAVSNAGTVVSNAATLTVTGPTCTAPPSTPGTLSATAASGQVSLTWGASTAAGCTVTYDLFRSATSGFTPAAENRIATGLTATTYVDTGLAASTPYYYVVQAVDAAGAVPSNQAAAITPGGGTGTLLSQGQPATASSTENAGAPASAAVDGNTGTRWSSAFSDPQWLQVDLGATSTISQVVLNWETAYATAFQVQTSDDAASWTTLYSTTTGKGGVQTLAVSGSGRYVRVYGTARATGYGYSLWEFRLYGSRSVTATLLSQGKTATASSTENAGTPASAAVDGNTGTRWSSAFSDPQWLQVDLGATRTISQVLLRWEAAYGKAYQIQTSNDAATWTTLHSTTTGAGGVETLNVSGSGRYVRMYGTARATRYGYSLWELQVYGQ